MAPCAGEGYHGGATISVASSTLAPSPYVRRRLCVREKRGRARRGGRGARLVLAALFLPSADDHHGCHRHHLLTAEVKREIGRE
jgi:hypothetical protein